MSALSRRFLIAGAAAAPALAASAVRAAETVIVLAAHPVAASLAEALAAGSAVRVERAVPATLPPGRMAAVLKGRGAAELERAARAADAVVTLRSVWPEDPLYPMARRVNIRLVEIDAATPLDGALPGVARRPRPPAGPLSARFGPGAAEGHAPHPWIGPANLARMAEILAADLRRLAPDAGERIDGTLAALRRRLQSGVTDAVRTLARAEAPAVVSLSDRFAYLAADLGLELADWLPLDDRDWTPERLAALTGFVRAQGVPVVLHHRTPADGVVRAVTDGGAALVVLDGLDGEGGEVVAALEDAMRRLGAAFTRAGGASGP